MSQHRKIVFLKDFVQMLLNVLVLVGIVLVAVKTGVHLVLQYAL